MTAPPISLESQIALTSCRYLRWSPLTKPPDEVTKFRNTKMQIWGEWHHPHKMKRGLCAPVHHGTIPSLILFPLSTHILQGAAVGTFGPYFSSNFGVTKLLLPLILWSTSCRCPTNAPKTLGSCRRTSSRFLWGCTYQNTFSISLTFSLLHRQHFLIPACIKV